MYFRKTMIAVTSLILVAVMTGCGSQEETTVSESYAPIAEVTETAVNGEGIETDDVTESEAENGMNDTANTTEERHIDTEYIKDEADTVAEIALAYKSASNSEEIIKYTDIDMIFYGWHGKVYETEELKNVIENELNISAIAPTECTVVALWVVDEDDVFWRELSYDSETFQFEYDISEFYTIDKAYKVFLYDDESTSHHYVYVARINGEWKVEILLEDYYDYTGKVMTYYDYTRMDFDTLKENFLLP